MAAASTSGNRSTDTPSEGRSEPTYAASLKWANVGAAVEIRRRRERFGDHGTYQDLAIRVTRLEHVVGRLCVLATELTDAQRAGERDLRREP